MKKNKSYLIITASDEKNGNFLINHWLKSLKLHINQKLVEIVILDYGLNTEQRKKINQNGGKIIKCKRNGHVVNIRYRDMLNIIKKEPYTQILTCDGSDIIFQKNIMHLFEEHKNEYRAVCEDMHLPAIEYTLLQSPFPNQIENEIKEILKNKKMINGGLVIGPRKKFEKLCLFMNKYITNKDIFGPDQVILNYILYKEGFVNLGREYNYVITTAKDKFKIKNGIFYDKNNQIIPIVHNAGGNKIFRPIKKFGHGSEYNKLSKIIYHSLRGLYYFNFITKYILNLFKKLK
jgi:lipopolysaccharide biosynthesis glycosyltransferase